MKHKWLKLRDRLIRMDRVHEFWINKEENGTYSVYVNIFGSPTALVENFPTYTEAEDFLNRITYALTRRRIIDVEELLNYPMEDEDEDFFF